MTVVDVESVICDLGAQPFSRLELCARVVDAADVKAFGEIGVWRGEFAEHILRACDRIERYYMIDPWRHLSDWNKPANVSDAEFGRVYEEAMARTSFAGNKRVVLRGTTTQVVPALEDETLDAVYIDGDHTLKGIAIDLITVYDKVRPGGLILGDDFSPTIWQHAARYEPTLVYPFAVYFAEAKGDPIYALPCNQFAIAKVGDGDSFEFRDLTGRYRQPSLGAQLPARPRPRRRDLLNRLHTRLFRRP